MPEIDIRLPWWKRLLFRLRNPNFRPPGPPYRAVTQRQHLPSGDDVVHLSCGHIVRLVHYQRTQIPCEQCKEEQNVRKP